MNVRTHVFVCMHVRPYVCMYVCVYVFMYVCLYACMCVRIWWEYEFKRNVKYVRCRVYRIVKEPRTYLYCVLAPIFKCAHYGIKSSASSL